MSRLLFIIENGQPVCEPDALKWAEWLHAADRLVARTMIGDIRVQTDFIGVNAYVSDPPLVWETMVFGGRWDGYQERHSSEVNARVGHERAVKLVETVEGKTRETA
jgi:hypothetical protein